MPPKRRRRMDDNGDDETAPKQAMRVHSTVYDVFSYPAVDLSTEDSEDVAHNPIQSGTNPILFEVDGNSDYIDLANTFLEFLVQVQDVGGNNMVDGRGHVCNNFFHTLMKQITFKINGTIVSPQTNEYAYNAYIETLLNYDIEQKSSVLANTIWSKDTPGQMDTLTTTAGNNVGMAGRNFFAAGAQYLLSGVPILDVFKLDRYLPPQTKLEMSITLHNNAFMFMTGAVVGGDPFDNTPRDNTYRPVLQVLSPRLIVRQVNPSSEIREKHIMQWRSKPMVFPTVHSKIETGTINAGMSSKHFDNIFRGKVPNNLILGMVLHNAYNGAYHLNPFNFQTFDVTSIKLLIDGKEISPNTTTLSGAYADRGYRNLFFQDGAPAMKGKGLDIERSDFTQGYALYRYNLLPSKGGTHHWIEGMREGNLSVDLVFENGLVSPVQVLFRGEFNKTLTITENGEALYV